MQITIDPETLNRFPDTQVAVFQARGMRKVTESLVDKTASLIAEASSVIQETFDDAAQVALDPRIAGWRRAIKGSGLKASAVRSSAEQLVRRLLRRKELGTGHPVVDAYCAVSARYVAPIGAYDLNRVPADLISLRPSQDGDVFDPLGGDPKSMPLKPEVIVYAAGAEVMCWAFNHRDSARTSLQLETDDALFVAEAVYLEQVPAMVQAIERMREVIGEAGGAVGEVRVAGIMQPTIEVAAAAPVA